MEEAGKLPVQGRLQIQADVQLQTKMPYCHGEQLITPMLAEPISDLPLLRAGATSLPSRELCQAMSCGISSQHNEYWHTGH